MTDRLRDKLADGRTAIGAWCTLSGTWSAEALGAAGFDWVVVDLQHGAGTWDGLTATVQAAELGGATALVRVPWNDPSSIMRALDVGAAGVIVPMVSDAAGAAAAVAACRYPPDGTRSWGPLRRRRDPAVANAEVLCLPQIETAAGLAFAEDIAAVPGVDGLFVGPVDLLLDLSGELDTSGRDPSQTGAVRECLEIALPHGRFVATTASSPGHARELVGLGVAMVTLGSDRGFAAAGAARALSELDDPGWADLK